MFERAIGKSLLEKLPLIFRHFYAILVVLVGWVFFRADTMIDAVKYLKGMVTFQGKDLANFNFIMNGEYYLFDTDGTMYAGNARTEFYDFKSNTYAVRTDGTLVTGKCGKIDGDKYYFDKTGIVQKNKIIKIGKKQYYFNGSGKMVHNRTFKL